MGKAYNEIMEEIQVDDEMRGRILRHLAQEMDAGSKKTVAKRRWRQLVPLAACLAVLLTGSILLLHRQPVEPEQVVSAQFGMEEVESAQALAERAGFSIRDIEPLPFEPLSVSYVWCWGELAQIRYDGADASVMLRKSRGSEDISGDYNVYSCQTELDIGGVSVTLKGEGESYSLAVWQADGFSYSLSAAPGLDAQSLAALVRSALYEA